MWIYCSQESTWVNTDKCLRLFRDGGSGWGFKSDDGQVTHLTNDEMEKVKEFFTRKPDKHERHEKRDTIEELRKKLDELAKDL